MCMSTTHVDVSFMSMWSIHPLLQDIGPRYAGVLLGLTNTAGVLAGVISTAATGYILSVGSWNDVWTSAICFYVLGTIIWNALATGEQIFD